MTQTDTQQLHDFIYQTFLSRVSRSFYLTLKIVPPEIRDTISLTYLLARITDNIIDDYHFSYYKKTYFIYLLQLEITNNSDEAKKAAFDQLLSRIINQIDDKESIQALPICLRYFSLIPPADKTLVVKVLTSLFKGFKRDIDTFTYRNKMVSLQSKSDLDNYLYDIAGCVGEFWTEICYLHWPDYSKLPAEKAIQLAIEFGKALQLTNILRDLPIDLQNNRCYLPAEQLSVEQIKLTDLSNSPENVFPLVRYWRDLAECYLKSAKQYIQNISSVKQRYALCIPVLIAEQTLAMLNHDVYLRDKRIMKISRFKIKIIMAKAALFSIFPKLL